jgi:hypothetical protein
MTPEKWNEGVEDKADWETPSNECVYYLRTLDGREFRWTNSKLILVPDTPQFKAMNNRT